MGIELKARASIRRLPEGTINRIAAGEVVERPASAVKELVENALDAGAKHVAITIAGGGAGLILVEDDGEGMDRDALVLAVERHATSKLPLGADGADDLTNIATLGFRGEALPSIGAVARLSIASRTRNSEAHAIRIEGGALSGPEPAGFLGAGESGSRVEVRDLFFATPARLKFLKSSRAESLAILDVVKRLAMARPEVGFSLTDEGRVVLSLPAEQALFDGALARLAKLMGREFADNAAKVRLCRLSGARPPSRTGSAHRLRSGLRRCQCASRESRSALPRFRAGARIDRRRAQGRIARSQPPRLDHGCGRRIGGVPGRPYRRAGLFPSGAAAPLRLRRSGAPLSCAAGFACGAAAGIRARAS
jgi:DNA mismatch repair protein MutL